MNTFALIAVAIVGIVLGMYLARHNKTNSLIDQQAEVKTANKEKILEFVQTNEKIDNSEVEKLTGVSRATAERYLDELEKEGKLTQHGIVGQSVFYTAK